MNKAEVFESLRKEYGFVPYISVFEMYNDGEQIPESFVHMVKVGMENFGKPRQEVLYCGAETARRLKEACPDLFK